jgi:predicted amidohydrolase YtcJ
VNERKLKADLILRKGKVLTVDRNFSIAQAVAIRDGVIIAVGKDIDVQLHEDCQTEIIDLGGKTVVPGFIDGHAHMDREGLKYIYPSLAGARSIREIVERIKREAEKAKPGEWIVMMPVGDPPYYENVPAILKEGRFPNR